MTPEQRTDLVIARSADYFGVMRTTLFTFFGIAAVIELGPGGFSVSLAVLIVAVTAYGVLAGGTAIDDIINLRDDMDDDMAATKYGAGVKARNLAGLKTTSTVLVGLIGLVELFAILF